MNGLQPVPIHGYKRLRYLPTSCPLGTRNTILSRCLVRERGALRWFTPDDTTSTTAPPQSPSPPTSQTTHLKEFTIRQVLGEDTTVMPSPHAAVPLDRKITGLTPLSLELREGPIRRLLKAIDRRADFAIWRYFSKIMATQEAPRLTAADYSSILLSVKPRRYISLKARHYLNDNGEARFTSAFCTYDEFRRRLHLISIGMQENGYRFSVLEYIHLLDCARAGNDRRMAEALWNKMAGQEDVVPDTWAYNSYMAAMCGTASTERELRVSERTLAERAALNDRNVRAQAMTIFRRMIDRGVEPNSMTFDILMLAMARMGDIHSVCRTLKEVWDVDVDSLASSPHTPESLPPAMARDSPLYPRDHTLVSVAAAFGSNNDVVTAIRVVDHLSRRYKLTISMATWTTLLNWTYVFTRPPTEVLPKYSVMNLWYIMTAPPYNIQPSLEMYDYFVRSLISRKMALATEKMINRGLRVYSHMRIRSSTAVTTLNTALAGFPENKLPFDEILTLNREVAFARREEFRGRSMVRRWVELFCIGKRMTAEHARIRVPNLVRRMGFFLGERVSYVTDSGYVDLMLGAKKLWRPMSVRRRKRKWTPLGTGAKEEDYFD